MKRSIGLFVVLMVGVALTTTMLKPRDANALDAKLTGDCTGLCVESTGLEYVLIQVKGGWTNTDAIELDITVTATNGCEEPGCIFHGRQIVPLSSTTVFSGSRDLRMVSVEWDDIDPSFHDEAQTYYVDVQVLVGGHPLGDVA